MKKRYETKKQRILPTPPIGQVQPFPIITDPQGCYTGRPAEAYETPVQDADDL